MMAPKPHYDAPGVLLRLDDGIGRMIMDGLKVFSLDAIALNSFDAVQIDRHIAHQILDEFRVVIGVLGDVLFISTLEQTPQLTRTLLFDPSNDLSQIKLLQTSRI